MKHTQVGRREFLVGLTGMTAVARRSTSHAQTPRTGRTPAFMYVGSFTSEGRGHGEGLSVFRRESSGWTLIQVLKELADPSFVIINRQHTHLYSAHGDGT